MLLVLCVACRCGELLLGDDWYQERLARPQHLAGGSLLHVRGPAPLHLLGERHEARVFVRHGDPPHAALLLDDVDDAPVREIRYDHARELVEGLLVVHRLAQDGSRVGKQGQAPLRRLEGGDVMEGADHELRLAVRAADERGAHQGPALVSGLADAETDQGFRRGALALRAPAGQRFLGEWTTFGIEELEPGHELLSRQSDRLSRVLEAHCDGRGLIGVAQLATHVDDGDRVAGFLQDEVQLLSRPDPAVSCGLLACGGDALPPASRRRRAVRGSRLAASPGSRLAQLGFPLGHDQTAPPSCAAMVCMP